MSDWDHIGFAPQGWQCPICKRVYSPWGSMCRYCGGEQKTVNAPSTAGTPIVEFVDRDRTISTIGPIRKE